MCLHQVLPSDAGMTAAARVAGVELVRLRLPDGVGAGLLHVEVQHGACGPPSTCHLPIQDWTSWVADVTPLEH